MIRFRTSRFGELEADDNTVITFPEGLVGLTDLKRYILIDHKDTALKWLQALDDPDIAFIVIPPDLIIADYSLTIDRNVRQFLQIEHDEDLAIFVIVRVSGNDVIANFQGPLLINSRTRTGIQAVLEGKATTVAAR